MFKKIVFITSLFFLLLPAKSALAYTDDSKMIDSLTSPTWDKPSFDFNTITNIMEGISIQVNGSGDFDIDQKTGSGAINTFGNLIGMMYVNPPASSAQYFADIGKRLQIVKPAYAQEEGFEGLKPILPIWKVFRDVAYMFFAIIFVVVGFAIMFRVKLNPQTVISLQNALPKIIVALILVTFSYAIAGFLIDLTYIINSLGIALINPQGTFENIVKWLGERNIGGGLDSPNIVTFYLLFMFKGGQYIGDLTDLLNPFSASPFLQQSALVSPLVKLASIPVVLILSIILLYTFIRLFITLLKAYISIILAIIFGPMQIMLNAIPGQNSFGGWLRNLLANLSVFPSVILMLALTSRITNEVAGQIGGSLWIPSPITPPLSMGHSPEVLVSLIAFGMLLMTPKVAEIIKEALQIKSYPYGTAIGEAFGPAQTLGGAALYTGVNYGERKFFGATRRGGPAITRSPEIRGLITGIKEGLQKRIIK